MNGARTVIVVAMVVMLAPFARAATTQSYDVAPELWDRPRSAAAILGDENVKRAVNALIARADAHLVIHHATAQEPALQAEELRAWLAALAVDARRVSLRSDLPAGAPMKLEVTP